MISENLYFNAKKIFPGGVCSPVRAIFPYPFYVKSASGAMLNTVDGIELVDCCLGYGPLLLGHKHPYIESAISDQLDHGWLFGTPTELELELASRIINDYPSIEMLRFVSTGTEATMSAIRLARGYTGKPDIVKVEGGFHGAHESVLISAGSGATTHGVPNSAGVIPEFANHTWQIPYNDPESLETLLSKNENIAAFIVEPVMGNMGVILPQDNYLHDIREITKFHDVVLIFDEVITGYRLGIGGAQVKYNIQPDLTTLGKIVGGGLPIGVFGGKRDIMNLISPSGPVYNSGTFNANPLSMAAGIATNKYLHMNPAIYNKLSDYTRSIEESIKPFHKGSFVRIGSMFQYFFRETAPQNYIEAKESNIDKFQKLWTESLSKGVFLAPSQFETNFVSVAHGNSELNKIISVFETLC
ncbi:MAG TPA: glutamate-1-semialdehyde 2,1-aminomutase [Methanocorpusculum sp.]|nr:glutamate-1-semialdehyde 2,1-aminomutase [Methanocorpusculum sp.]